MNIYFYTTFYIFYVSEYVKKNFGSVLKIELKSNFIFLGDNNAMYQLRIRNLVVQRWYTRWLPVSVLTEARSETDPPLTTNEMNSFLIEIKSEFVCRV